MIMNPTIDTSLSKRLSIPSDDMLTVLVVMAQIVITAFGIPPPGALQSVMS